MRLNSKLKAACLAGVAVAATLAAGEALAGGRGGGGGRGGLAVVRSGGRVIGRPAVGDRAGVGHHANGSAFRQRTRPQQGLSRPIWRLWWLWRGGGGDYWGGYYGGGGVYYGDADYGYGYGGY